MDLPTSISISSGIFGAVAIAFKTIPRKPTPAPPREKDPYMEKIIDIADKLSRSMAIMQSKSESIHHSVKNIDAVGKVMESNIRSRMELQAQKMAGMEEKVEQIWKSTVK